MKSILIKAPRTTDIETLPPEIVAAINSVIGQWVWVGKEVNGYGLLDCTTTDSFDPALFALVPDWTLLAMWQWNGNTPTDAYTDDEGTEHPAQNQCEVLLPVAAETIQFLPDFVTYDANGVEVSRTAPIAWYECHGWAGWPPRIAQSL